ncbi:inactive ubiquitin carboxyl-terminal hydrolase MINDY-4B [Corvus kubaryi]|uniref:inactive ubiquitin carboxyl-terminal hydrolase MINDY-4B n=1 Tax=Corvus kubaryi TaxID=68294 RepID=UPI001C053132|nr:inactive ubiquitin carboxyl-terminal hydrolase MINDY-4B [Corvus kubaryi]
MGDRGAEHAAPTELEEITSRISDLTKWREIFSFHGCGHTHCTCTPRPPDVTDPSRWDERSDLAPLPPPPPQRLQKLLFRNMTPLFSFEWAAAHFRFRPPHSDLAYALEAGKGGTRAILVAVQAHIISYLLFTRETPHGTHENYCLVSASLWVQANQIQVQVCSYRWGYALGKKPWLIPRQGFFPANPLISGQWHVPPTSLVSWSQPLVSPWHRLCRVGQWEQGQALATALAETLWAAGGGGRAVVCLITAPITMMPPREGYRANSFTERIQLFEFSEKAAAQGFISDHIHCFKGEGSHGVILFLYSLLFSRTLERVQEDLGDTAPLLNISSGNITCTEAVLSLLLTGRASPRELGGSQELESGTGDGDGEAPWQRGPGQRHGQRDPRQAPGLGTAQVPAKGPRAQVSPGLRTPRLPVWLCSVSGRHSVLFGTDSRLLSDWKSERIFHLYFYSGQQEQTQTAHLTIDTHSHHWEEAQREDPSSPRKRHPALEMAIRTKWAGATVSWNGTDPFF